MGCVCYLAPLRRHDGVFSKLRIPLGGRILDIVGRSFWPPPPPAGKIATLQDRTLTLKVNQAALVRGGDRFCPAHDVQLVENASHVGLHGRFADEKI